MNDNRNFFNGILSKLSVLLGGAVVAAGTQASGLPTVINQSGNAALTTKATAIGRPLSAKLTLKQQKSGFVMVAEHSSHASHASHASHSSHTSSAF